MFTDFCSIDQEVQNVSHAFRDTWALGALYYPIHRFILTNDCSCREVNFNVSPSF